ncbi:MAG: cytochrome c4 [Gammaproteobacteria bacterium]|nr:cytochrome c4 [Gammaproteobacteria bacterium]
MIKKVSIAALFVALVSLVGGAQAGGDAAAGKDKAGLCMGCHGEDGMSVNPECPSLAGQKAGYIIKQVTDFQKGHRQNDTMTAMAMMAGELQDIKDIAAFYASQKPMAASRFMMPPPDDKKSIAEGEKIFENGNPRTGLYGCINCHGKSGKGKSKNNHVFPIIGGQTRDYIAKQLKDFRSATRKNDPANMMMDIAKKLSDKEIDALADYLGSRN